MHIRWYAVVYDGSGEGRWERGMSEGEAREEQRGAREERERSEGGWEPKRVAERGVNASERTCTLHS